MGNLNLMETQKGYKSKMEESKDAKNKGAGGFSPECMPENTELGKPEAVKEEPKDEAKDSE
jgi:hypothetical protein